LTTDDWAIFLLLISALMLGIALYAGRWGGK